MTLMTMTFTTEEFDAMRDAITMQRECDIDMMMEDVSSLHQDASVERIDALIEKMQRLRANERVYRFMSCDE